MKCKNCPKRKKSNSRNGKPYKCWENGLCGTCFAKLMPEKCKPNQKRKYK